jgi:Mg-chelatase subunit ChlD/type II secretory pathway pseudopilin PulG
MNPELPPNPREELEQRLTALLLGELSAEESAALHRAMEQDGELAKLFARLHHTVGLVRETVASPSEPPSAQAAPAKLSTARREKLLAHFKTIAPPEFAPEKRRVRFTLVEFAAVMIILGLLAAISFPTLSNFGNWGAAESAHLNIELAPDAALEVAKPHRGEQLERAPTALAFRAFSSADSSETPTSGLNRSETLTADFAVSDFDAGTTAKRPTALTPLPSAPSAAGSHDSFARSSTVIGDDGLTLGDKPELGQSFYRFNPDSGGAGRGGLPQLSGPVDAGEPGKAAEGEPLLRENIPVRYTSPGSVAVALESSTNAWSDNRTLTRADSVDPATGFEIARAGDLPASSGQQLETRTFNVKPEVLYQALEGVGGLALTGLGEQTPQTQFGIPRVGVTGASSGGGGGGGGQGGGGSSFSLVTNSLAGTDGAVNKFYSDLGVNLDANAGESVSYDDRSGKLTVRATRDGSDVIEQVNRVLAVEPPEVNIKTKFSETTQNEDRALGYDWYLGSKLNTGKDALTAQGGTTPSSPNQPVDVLNEGVVTTLSGRAAGVDFANGATPSGSTPLGRSGTDSEGDAPASPLLDGGRIAPEPNVYSVDAMGYFDVPTQPATSAGVAINESRRQSASIVLPGLAASADSKKAASDELLTELRRTETSLAQPDASARRLRVSQQQLQKGLANLEKQRELKSLGEELEPMDVPIRKPSTNAPIPQPEIQTRDNNFSTFSLNVSDVSFKLAAASLEKGQMPDAASVRSEEFINAFDYRDPEPAAGAPIAFAYERARYPFAHNRDLLRFSLKTAAAGRRAGRPLNLVLLLDNSGSMERADRVRIIREALRVLAEQLQPQDKLSVITFSRTARLIADGISGDKAGEVAEQVSGITPQGGTNLEDAMNLAYETAARHYLANGINRVVLLTDGAANLGDVEPDSLKQKVEAQRQQGIALDCFGIGWEGLNDDLLEVLSRNGDGRYGFINSPEEAATDFVGQLAGALKVAASDVKVQVEFNPKRVTSYRQIGYAKHQLTKEQFRDNTVDAAEIAAQEAGNALYTVELNPAGVGPLGTVRVRYKVPGTTDYREQAWDVPYTGNSPALGQASPAMRLAASASAFSEWLVASPFASEVTPDALLGYLNGVPEVFGADSRPKKLEWMIRQAKSLEGK